LTSLVNEMLRGSSNRELDDTAGAERALDVARFGDGRSSA
jgi:hypothetical protein